MQIKQATSNEKQVTYIKNKSNVRALLTLLFVGVLYYIWIINTGICIPCIFRLITGYKCPGCGVTTMIVSLSRLNFKGAFIANSFLFITGPFVIAEIIYSMIKNNRNEKMPRWNTVVLYIYIAFLLIFGILRNIINI